MDINLLYGLLRDRRTPVADTKIIKLPYHNYSEAIIGGILTRISRNISSKYTNESYFYSLTKTVSDNPATNFQGKPILEFRYEKY